MIKDAIGETEFVKDANIGVVQVLNKPWRWIVKTFELTDKNRKFVAILIFTIFSLLYSIYGLGKELASTKGDLKLANSKIEEKEKETDKLRSENKELRDRI